MKKGKVSKVVATALLAGAGAIALTGCTKDETGDKRVSRDSNSYTYDPTTDDIVCEYGVEIDPDYTTEYDPTEDDIVCKYGAEIDPDEETTESEIYNPDDDISVEVYGPPEDFED